MKDVTIMMIQNPESSESQCDSPLAGEAGAAAQMESPISELVKMSFNPIRHGYVTFCIDYCKDVQRFEIGISLIDNNWFF